jgi:hypothetical protein
VVEEQRGAGVETGDAVICSSVSSKSKDVNVFALALRAYRLRYDDDAALGQPPEDDLTDGLAVCLPDLAEQRVGKEVVSAFGEWAPQDSIWMPRSRISSWSAVRWKNGWVSIW